MASYTSGVTGRITGRLGQLSLRTRTQGGITIVLTPRRDARTEAQMECRRRFRWYAHIWRQVYRSHLKHMFPLVPDYMTGYSIAMDNSLSLPLDGRFMYPLLPISGSVSVIPGFYVEFRPRLGQWFIWDVESWTIPGSASDYVFLLMVRESGSIWFCTPYGWRVEDGAIRLPFIPRGGEHYRFSFAAFTPPGPHGGFVTKHLATYDIYYYPN